MKILVTSSTGRTNPVIPLLVRALSGHPGVETVQSGRELFWEDPRDVDVVHQHWPEEIFGWELPSDDQMRLLQPQFDRWRERSAIVATIHNYHPHYRDTDAARRLYALVYANADGFIHHGRASLDDHRERYPGLAGRPHVVIPAGIDAAFENTVTRSEARAALGIPLQDRVFLSLGKLRDVEELRLLLRGFGALRLDRKRLLVSAHRLGRGFISIPFLDRVAMRLSPRIRMNQDFVPPGRVQHWVNAADVVVIPRMRPLNSASISLGFSFGRVVAGPDTGVVGEILRATGNPTFDPRDRRSTASALERAAALAAEGLGQRNRRHAETHWGWDELAAQHVAFFRDVRARAGR